MDFSNSTGYRRSFEWESFNLTNSTTGYHEAVAWIHGDWLRDNTTQLKVHYGDGSTVENGANPWGEAGVNAELVQHLNGNAEDSTSNGANGNVNRTSLIGRWKITWTGMRVRKHDGAQHHLVGIQPDVRAERTIHGVRAGRDDVLEKGIEVLRQK